MKKIRDVRKLQNKFIQNQKTIVNDFCIPLKQNDKITSILLSGSVARGTFMPGEKGGAIDLIIFCKDLDNFNAENILGKDLEKNIPGHCIKYNETHFQIKIYDDNYIINFKDHNEAEKYAFFESIILYDINNNIKSKINNELQNIKNHEITIFLKNNFYYSKYLINDLQLIKNIDIKDYNRRETIFKSKLLQFIEERLKTAYK